MARPPRHNVDYFPHYISDGKKMFIIESKFGNDGYAAWFKILETLAKTDNHWIDLKDDSNLMFLSAKCRVSDSVLMELIEAVVKLGEIDAQLWNQQKVIWCQKFVDSIEDAYRKRNNECITKPSLLLHLKGLGRNIKGLGSIKDAVKPQSKVEHSKVEETIHTLVIWLNNNCPIVQGLSQPLNNEQAIKLIDCFDKRYISEQFEAMENHKPLKTKSVSAYKTFLSWSRLKDHYKNWKTSNTKTTFNPHPDQ